MATTRNWGDPLAEDEERKPDPHDSALSVGTNPMADPAKYRELEEELHNMTEKVASACKCLRPLPQKKLPTNKRARATP